MDKVLIFLLAFIIIQVQSEGLDTPSDVQLACYKKENITADEVFDIEDGIEVIRKSVEKNPKEKCYIACVLEHVHILKGCEVQLDDFFGKDNELNLQKENIMQAKKCAERLKGKTDRCECGFLMLECVLED